MGFSLKDSVIKGKTLKPPRILLYGPAKMGKSTFGSKFKNHIFLNMEDGLDNIDCIKTPRVKSAREAMEILGQLNNEPHDYKCLIVDTIDWLEKAICIEVAGRNEKDTVEEMGWGTGYPLVVNRWGQFLEAFEILRNNRNMTILLLSHAEIKKYTPPIGVEYDIFSPKLFGKKDKTQTSLALLVEFSDIIMFANYRTITKETGIGSTKRSQAIKNINRILYTDSCNPAFIAGNRYNLEPELPFTFEAFAADYANKIAQPKDATNEKEAPKDE